MAKTGSINERIFDSVAVITTGRDAWDTEGLEAMGRVTFRKGIAEATLAFKEACDSDSVKTIAQSELTFVSQELLFCDKGNKYVMDSLNASITDFKDVLNALKSLEKEDIYKHTDNFYSTRREGDRIGGLPNDVVHKAFKSQKARLQNSLKTSTVGSVERELVLQRIENLDHGRNLYKAMQKDALKPSKSTDKGMEM
jgi:hypothetical protein